MDIRIETSPAAPGNAARPDAGKPDELAILPLRETVLFPQAVIPLAVARPSSVRAVDEAVLGSRLIGLVTQLDAAQETPAPQDLHRMGTVATIHRMLKQSDGTIRLVVQGLERFRVVEFTQTTPHLRARIERVPDIGTAADDVEAQALERQAQTLFQRIVELSPTLSDDLLPLVAAAGNAGQMIDLIAATLPSLTTVERQTLLETPDVKERVQEIVLMGGGLFEGGNTTPAAEFNIYCDAESARSVFHSSVTKTLIPIDVSSRVVMSFDLLAKIPDGASRSGAVKSEKSAGLYPGQLKACIAGPW